MKKKFLLSACLALSLVLAGCNSAGGNSTIKGSGPVEGVRLTQDTFNVDIGETYFLKSFVEFTPTYPADQTYTLETSDETIFTVDSDQGSFTGVSVGIGTLTLTTNDGGYTASASVIVGGGIVEDEPDDAGDASITYENYTIVFTIYDSDLQIQKALDGDSLYIEGDYDGTWNDGGWYDWNGFTQLTETEDDNGNVAYALHLDSVIGGTHEFMICYGSASWNPIYSGGNYSFTIATTAQSGDTQYVKCLNSYNFESHFGGSGDEDGGEVTFYLLIVDGAGTSAENVSTNATWTSGNNLFGSTETTSAGKGNGSTECGYTVTTTASGAACLYNTTAGLSESGFTDWFSVYTKSLNWSDEIKLNTLTFPNCAEGNVAVYVANQADSTVDLSKIGTENASQTVWGEWVTSYSSIDAVIATL